MSDGGATGGEPLSERLGGVSNVLLSAPTFSPDETPTCAAAMNVADPSELNALAITYKRDPDRWLADFLAHFGDEPERLQIISVSEAGESVGNAGESVVDEQHVETIQSPQDLTGLGIHVSEYLRRVEETKWDSGATNTVICFDSITALLQYVDAQRAFRFFHIVTARVSAVEATAHYHIHPDALDEQTVNTLQTLFDALVKIGDDGVESVVSR